MFHDQFDLERFVSAQEAVYSQALAEIRRGAKRSHWMWFTFPKLAGLGRSEMARRYAISGLEEARAYLAHPVLSDRYRESVTALQDLETSDAEAVFGPANAQKLCCRSHCSSWRPAKSCLPPHSNGGAGLLTRRP